MRKPAFLPRENEHRFAQYVRILGKGKSGSRSLTQTEANDAMSMILQGEVEDVQLGAFLMLLRVNEESADEITGFVKAARQHINTVSSSIKSTSIHADIDWSSYAGKRYQLPWFLLSCQLLASHGIRIFMHGSCGHTAGRLYTEQVLTALNIPLCHNWESVDLQLQQTQFAFMPLSSLCPELQAIINLRNVLGLRSPVHTLARLLNPLNCTYTLQSVFHPAYADTHQQAALKLGEQNSLVFKGEAGEVERKPDANTVVKYCRNGELYEETWPRLQSEKQERLKRLDIEQMQTIWRQENTSSTPLNDYALRSILGTTAIVLKLLDKADNQASAMQLATTLWQQRDRHRI